MAWAGAVGTTEAAITATSAVASIAAAVTAIIAATAIATFVAEAATIAACTWRAWLHGTSFIDDQAATTQWLTIHSLNGGLCLCFTGHFYETKAFGATCVTFHHDARTFYSSKLAECLLQIV